MLKMNKDFFFTIISLISLLLFSFFLNFSSSLYSEIDLFRLDLTKKRKSLNKKKLIFVLKNSYLFFAVVCFFQVVINFFISSVLVENMKDDFMEKL